MPNAPPIESAATAPARASASTFRVEATRSSWTRLISLIHLADRAELLDARQLLRFGLGRRIAGKRNHVIELAVEFPDGVHQLVEARPLLGERGVARKASAALVDLLAGILIGGQEVRIPEE